MQQVRARVRNSRAHEHSPPKVPHLSLSSYVRFAVFTFVSVTPAVSITHAAFAIHLYCSYHSRCLCYSPLLQLLFTSTAVTTHAVPALTRCLYHSPLLQLPGRV